MSAKSCWDFGITPNSFSFPCPVSYFDTIVQGRESRPECSIDLAEPACGDADTPGQVQNRRDPSCDATSPLLSSSHSDVVLFEDDGSIPFVVWAHPIPRPFARLRRHGRDCEHTMMLSPSRQWREAQVPQPERRPIETRLSGAKTNLRFGH